MNHTPFALSLSKGPRRGSALTGACSLESWPSKETNSSAGRVPSPLPEIFEKFVIMSLSKDLGLGRLPNSRIRIEIKSCQLLLAVWIAAFAAMTRLSQRCPQWDRIKEMGIDKASEFEPKQPSKLTLGGKPLPRSFDRLRMTNFFKGVSEARADWGTRLLRDGEF